MRAEAIDYRYVESKQRNNTDRERQEGLLTAARRAGLDALEREFSEFVKTRAR